MVLIIGIICDIGVEIIGISMFTGTESFVDYIFSAIVTVSVLSITLISMIGSSLKDTYYGYELKTILRFKKSSINLNAFSTVTLSNIVIAIGLLAAFDKFTTVNALMAVLVATIIMIIVMSWNVNEIISNDKFCRERVGKYVASIMNQDSYCKENFTQDIDSLFKGWKAAVEMKNLEEKEEVVDLVIKLINAYKNKEKKQYQIVSLVNSKLNNIIEDSSLSFGYQAAVLDVIKIYEAFTDSYYDRSDIICKPLNRLAGYGDAKILEVDYLQDIIELYFIDAYEEKRVTDNLISTMYYHYFKAIKDNVVCSPRLRSQLIKQFIKKMTTGYLDDKDKKLTNEQNVLLGILRCDIIQNENIDEREQFYKLLLQNIIEQTYYGKQEYGFNNYVSMVGQVIFNYCLMESELLTQEYRDQLKQLVKNRFASPNIALISLRTCLQLNIENVLKAFAKRIQNNDNEDYRYYDYFPGYTCVKNVVWGLENDVLYFMLLYVLFYDEIIPIDNGLFFEWKTMDHELKDEITTAFGNLFETERKCFKAFFVDLIYEFSELLGYGDTEKVNSIINKNQEFIFCDINELRKDTVIDFSKTIIVPNTDELLIEQELKDFMEEEEIYGWDSDFKDGNIIEFVMTPVYGRKRNRTNREIARNIKEATVQGINWYVAHKTKRLFLSHDLEGINAFSRYLQKNKLLYRNFDFLNNYRIKKLDLSEEDLTEVRQLNSHVILEKTKGIKTPMLYNKEKFRFNIEIIDYKPRDLTDEEALWYIGDKGAYSGLYSVEGVLMPKEQAVEVIKQNICVEQIRIKLIFAMDRKDIVHIEFRDRPKVTN